MRCSFVDRAASLFQCPGVRVDQSMAYNRYHFNLAFFSKFFKELKIIFPRWNSGTVFLFTCLLCLVLLEQFVVYYVGLLPSEYYRVFGEKDWDGFKRHLVYSVALIVSIAFIVSAKKYVSSEFYVTSRQLLTERLHTAYFADINYYKLNALEDDIDNVDQRMTQDVDKMCNSFSLIIADLLVSPFTIVYYTYLTWSRTGYIGPVCVFAFFISSTVINKFLMSPVVALVFRQEQLEGDFRFKHVTLRSNCEAAAFLRCGRVELKKTNEKLQRLLLVQHRLVFAQFPLNFSVNMAAYFGSILSYIILAIPIFGGVYDDLSPADLSALISENAFVTIYLISCFTRLIDMAPEVTDIAGTAHRIGELLEKAEFHSSYEEPYENLCASSSSKVSSSTIYTLDGVSLAAPTSFSSSSSSSQLLLKDLSLELRIGVNLLITGDSGCGKSSLLRALDGLWPIADGSIIRAIPRGCSEVFFLPQKPYLTNGTLRQQIIFPESEDISSVGKEQELVKYLEVAGLSKLLKRAKSLDFPLDWNWYDILSPGEIQRIGFVRLFYHQPRFAVLDEATSQVSIDLEQRLYAYCVQLGITLLSIGHRSTLRHFHQMELCFSGPGGRGDGGERVEGSTWHVQPVGSEADSTSL